MTHIFTTAANLRADGTPFVLATVIASYPPQSARPGAKAIIRADGTIDGWVGGGCVQPVIVQEAAQALADRLPRLVRLNTATDTPTRHGTIREYPMTCHGEGGIEIYLEPVLSAPRLVVLGSTPVALSLARLGTELGYEIIVSSSAPLEPLPTGARIVADACDALVGADETTFVVVATMGVGDEDALAAAAQSDAPYIGLVASRKKAKYLLEYAAAQGVPAERLGRVKAPAGLDLGGMSAPGIALSILAEIEQRRHMNGHAPSSEAHTPVAAPFPLDPICGMPVNPAQARHMLSLAGETLYFCCPHCKAAYEREHTIRA